MCVILSVVCIPHCAKYTIVLKAVYNPGWVLSFGFKESMSVDGVGIQHVLLQFGIVKDSKIITDRKVWFRDL